MKKIAVIALLAAMTVGAPTLTLAQEDVNSLITSIGGQGFIESLDTLDQATSVTVIAISTMGGGEDAAIEEGLASKAQDIASLQARVSSNTEATSALSAAGYTPDQVVAISSTSDGAVRLYVNDMASGDVTTTTDTTTTTTTTTPAPAADTTTTAGQPADSDATQNSAVAGETADDERTDTSVSANDQEGGGGGNTGGGDDNGDDDDGENDSQ